MRIKTLLILLSLSLFFYEHGAAQWPVYTEDIVADAQEVQPVFRGGGMDTFADWVKKQVIYFQNFNSPKGVVEIYFTVDKKGKIQDVEFESSPNPELTDAVLKAIDNAPSMTPGTRNGEPSEFRLLAVINFDRYITSESPNLRPNSDSKAITQPNTNSAKLLAPDEVGKMPLPPRFSKSGKKYNRERDMDLFKKALFKHLNINQLGEFEGGKVEIVFTVNYGGYIENVTINSSSSRILLKAIMKALYSMPKWHSPGFNMGESACVTYTLPFIISVPEPLPENQSRERFH